MALIKSKLCSTGHGTGVVQRRELSFSLSEEKRRRSLNKVKRLLKTGKISLKEDGDAKGSVAEVLPGADAQDGGGSPSSEAERG